MFALYNQSLLLSLNFRKHFIQSQLIHSRVPPNRKILSVSASKTDLMAEGQDLNQVSASKTALMSAAKDRWAHRLGRVSGLPRTLIQHGESLGPEPSLERLTAAELAAQPPVRKFVVIGSTGGISSLRKYPVRWVRVAAPNPIANGEVQYGDDERDLEFPQLRHVYGAR